MIVNGVLYDFELFLSVAAAIFGGIRKSMGMKIMLSDSKATERFTKIINSAMGISLCRRLLRSRISGVFFRLDEPISSAGMWRYRQLSICNRFSSFLPRFPDIPRKISAYLLTDFFSGANTRKIRGFYKILDINDLYLRDIFSFSKKHHFGL